MTTAIIPDALWQFPAAAPARRSAARLGEVIRDLGVPTVAARTAALRQLVTQPRRSSLSPSASTSAPHIGPGRGRWRMDHYTSGDHNP
jgi:hypothetical protein